MRLLREAPPVPLALDQVAVGDAVVVNFMAVGWQWLPATVTQVHFDGDGDRTWDVRYDDDGDEEEAVTPSCMLSPAEAAVDAAFVVACGYGCERAAAGPEFAVSAARMWRQAWVALSVKTCMWTLVKG